MADDKRDTNIELLRIIAMILIIGHHYVQYGIYNSTIKGNVINFWKMGGDTEKVIASLLYPGGRVGNYIFFMLSGYFLINRAKRISINKVIKIAIFYSVALSVLTDMLASFGIMPVGITFPKITIYTVAGVFTPLTDVWWFISAYILLMLLVPIINNFISCLTVKGYFVLLLILWLPFSVIDYMFNSPMIEIEMALYFYLLGGFVRRSDLAKKYNALIWAILTFIAWLCSAALTYFANMGVNNDYFILKIILKISTGLDAGGTSLLAALFFCCTFINLKVKYTYWINRVAESTIAVYMIHEYPPIRYFLWNSVFDVPAAYQKPLFLIYSVVSIAVVYVGCIAIDQARICIFNRYIDMVCDRIKGLVVRYGITI